MNNLFKKTEETFTCLKCKQTLSKKLLHSNNVCRDCYQKHIQTQQSNVDAANRTTNNQKSASADEIVYNLVKRFKSSFEESKKMEYVEKEQLTKHERLSNNNLLGFIGALFGALIGSIPWAVIYANGYIAAYCGFLIAICSSKGYDLMRVKPGKQKFWFVLILTLVGEFFATILGGILLIYKELSTYHIDVEFSKILEVYFDNFGSIISESISDLVMGVVFAILGCLSVLRDISKKREHIDRLKAKYSQNRNHNYNLRKISLEYVSSLKHHINTVGSSVNDMMYVHINSNLNSFLLKNNSLVLEYISTNSSGARERTTLSIDKDSSNIQVSSELEGCKLTGVMNIESLALQDINTFIKSLIVHNIEAPVEATHQRYNELNKLLITLSAYNVYIASGYMKSYLFNGAKNKTEY